MNVFAKLWSILPLPEKPIHIPTEAEIAERRDLTVRRIAKRNAEGNVLLGLGRIVTQETIEARRKKLSF